jgi:DNA-binding NarL/FixJ family response regulator
MSGSVRVVIADDQALVRAGFRAILETAGGVEVVAEAATGEEAVSATRRHQPDVVLLDIQMPRLDGLDAARQILATTFPPRVIMLTTFDLDEYLYESMRAGASGFLLKDTPREQLINTVRTVAAGDALLSSQVAHRLIERFVTSEPERRSSTREEHPLTLTAVWRPERWMRRLLEAPLGLVGPRPRRRLSPV